MISATVLSWLVDHGLPNAAVYSATGLVVTAGLGKAWAAFHRVHPLKMLQDHAAAQKRIADALDTNKPGGLTDVVQALNKEEEA